MGEITNLVGDGYKNDAVKNYIEKSDKVVEITAKIKSLNVEIDRLNSQANELHTSYTAAKADLDQKKRDLEQINGSIQREIETKRIDLSALQEKIRTTTEEMQNLESRRDTADKALHELNTSYDTEKDGLDKKLAGEREKFATAVQGLSEQYKSAKAEKEREIEGLGLKISELNGKKTVMEQQLEKFQKEGQDALDRIIGDKDNLEQEVIPGLKKEVGHLNGVKEDLIADVTKLGEQVKDLSERRQAIIRQNMGIKFESKADKKLARRAKKIVGGEKA